jgi:hypothetical protein
MTEAASKIKLERGARFYNVGKTPTAFEMGDC